MSIYNQIENSICNPLFINMLLKNDENRDCVKSLISDVLKNFIEFPIDSIEPFGNSFFKNHPFDLNSPVEFLVTDIFDRKGIVTIKSIDKKYSDFQIGFDFTKTFAYQKAYRPINSEILPVISIFICYQHERSNQVIQPLFEGFNDKIIDNSKIISLSTSNYPIYYNEEVKSWLEAFNRIDNENYSQIHCNNQNLMHLVSEYKKFVENKYSLYEIFNNNNEKDCLSESEQKAFEIGSMMGLFNYNDIHNNQLNQLYRNSLIRIMKKLLDNDINPVTVSECLNIPLEDILNKCEEFTKEK